MAERGRGGRRAGFTSFWPLPTSASVRVLIIAFNRDKEQLLMMLLLILTCSCLLPQQYSLVGALLIGKAAPLIETSLQMGRGTDTTYDGRTGRVAPVVGLQEQNRGR